MGRSQQEQSQTLSCTRARRRRAEEERRAAEARHQADLDDTPLRSCAHFAHEYAPPLESEVERFFKWKRTRSWISTIVVDGLNVLRNGGDGTTEDFARLRCAIDFFRERGP